MTLPPVGSAARNNLESQAISLAERCLREHEDIEAALFNTHSELVDRGHDRLDSGILVNHVVQVWITKILESK